MDLFKSFNINPEDALNIPMERKDEMRLFIERELSDTNLQVEMENQRRANQPQCTCHCWNNVRCLVHNATQWETLNLDQSPRGGVTGVGVDGKFVICTPTLRKAGLMVKAGVGVATLNGCAVPVTTGGFGNGYISQNQGAITGVSTLYVAVLLQVLFGHN